MGTFLGFRLFIILLEKVRKDLAVRFARLVGITLIER